MTSGIACEVAAWQPRVMLHLICGGIQSTSTLDEPGDGEEHLEEGIGGVALLQERSKLAVTLRLLHFHQQRPYLLKFCRVQSLEAQLLLPDESHLGVRQASGPLGVT